MLEEQKLKAVPPLSHGNHANLQEGACIMEAVSYIAGEAWSDHPECVCPVISAFLRSWNDSLPDSERDELLRPLIPLVLNTRSTSAVERRRAAMSADWLIREHTVAWLRLANLTTQADALAALPEIKDFAECPALMPTLRAVQSNARAAWDAARVAAGNAAWNAAWDAAGNAAWDAAWNAARVAAGNAAWDAARVAAGNAAWDAARVALASTKIALQQSALMLVHRMIAVTDYTL